MEGTIMETWVYDNFYSITQELLALEVAKLFIPLLSRKSEKEARYPQIA